MNKDGGPLPDKYNENEIFVGGELSKREGNILHYHAIGEVGLAGKAIGQFNVKGDIDLNFPLWKDTVSLIHQRIFTDFVRSECGQSGFCIFVETFQ